MNFIILDIEATCWEGKPPNMVQETIEIGAVKMTRFGEVLGEFNRLIRPILHPTLSHYCRRLTNIRQEELDRSARFPAVIEAFKEWADVYDEEYWLCSWGSFDERILRQDCRLHDLDDAWLDPFLNLKQQYHELKRLRKRRGLRYAVEAEGFDFSGEHHRGMPDAQNLSKIFVKFLDEWQY